MASYVQSAHTSRGTALNKAQAIQTLRAKGYSEADINRILSENAVSRKDPHNDANRAPLYDVAQYPDYKAPAPAAATPTTPTTAKPTTPAAPVETPHQKAIRLAKAEAAKYYAGAYGDLGLGTGDPYGVGKKFNQYLDEALADIPATQNTIDLNYGDFFNKALTGATAAGRNTLTQAYNAATPYGWEDQYFGATADDPILNEILAQQYGDVTGNLNRQLERGQISKGAYDYAMNQLGTLAAPGALTTAAMSTLQNIGGSVLSGYKEDLGDVGDEFSKLVTNYQLGQKIDPKQLTTNIQNTVNTLTGSLKGDITKALGSTQLYDPNSLVAKAGSATGPSNQPGYGSNPQGTGTVPQEEQDKRTIGTSGVF